MALLPNYIRWKMEKQQKGRDKDLAFLDKLRTLEETEDLIGISTLAATVKKVKWKLVACERAFTRVANRIESAAE